MLTTKYTKVTKILGRARHAVPLQFASSASFAVISSCLRALRDLRGEDTSGLLVKI